jgi:hypothetical protein
MKSINPQQISLAIAMREAGYTVLAISQQLGLSVRTLQRHLSRSGAKKGKATGELVEAAKSDLRKLLSSSESIRDLIACQVRDDLAHAAHLREIVIKASEHLQADSLRDAVLVMRAAAAYSTAIKNTSDTIRHSLGVKQIDDGLGNDLPELVIRELTTDQIRSAAHQDPAAEPEVPETA